MGFREAGGLRYYSFEIFPPAVLQAVFTRHGGVSPAPWASLNVGGLVGDEAVRVTENRRRSLTALGRPDASMFDAWLVHGTEVLCAEEPRLAGQLPGQADAVLTDRPEVTLFLRFADCVPILLHDPVHKVVGIAHAGWMGTIAGIVVAVLGRMTARYGSRPGDILAAIGPSIGPDHYEIGPDVSSRLETALPAHAPRVLLRRDGRTFFDLWEANRLQLIDGGVTQIENSGLCTACHTDDWYSHRAERGKTGRFGALMALASPR